MNKRKIVSIVRKLQLKERKRLLVGVGILVVIGGLAASGLLAPNQNGAVRSQSTKNSAASGETPELPPAIAQKEISREFAFPVRDQGEEVSRMRYVISDAQLRDVIITKGQRANAIKGKDFMVLNLKITNNYTVGIDINARDYIRLRLAGSDEWLAPEIHNDPVEVQALSTKQTRLGFIVEETTEPMTLRVGEINGEKDEFQLSFN